jgi:hypothetical protein
VEKSQYDERQGGLDSTCLSAGVGLVEVTTAKDGAGVGLSTAPVGSGGGVDRVRVDGVVASLDLGGGEADRGGEEDGGVEHVCKEDLRRHKR